MPKHRSKYRWPASQIDPDIMTELHLVSCRTKIPITRLVSEAVTVAMNARLEQSQPPAPIGFVQPQPPRPAA